MSQQSTDHSINFSNYWFKEMIETNSQVDNNQKKLIRSSTCKHENKYNCIYFTLRVSNKEGKIKQIKFTVKVPEYHKLPELLQSLKDGHHGNQNQAARECHLGWKWEQTRGMISLGQTQLARGWQELELAESDGNISRAGRRTDLSVL